MAVWQIRTITGAISTTNALALVGNQIALPNASVVKGFDSTVKLSDATITLNNALTLNGKVAIGLTTVTGNPTLSEVRQLAANDAYLNFASNTTLNTAASANAITIKLADALALKSANVAFTQSDTVTLQLDANNTNLSAVAGNIVNLKAQGVDFIAAGVDSNNNPAPLSLTLGQLQGLTGLSTLANDLSAPTGLAFKAADTVILNAVAADVPWIAAHAAQLSALNVDQLKAAGASLTLNVDQFNSLRSNNIALTPADSITLNLTAGDIASLFTNSNGSLALSNSAIAYLNAGVDTFNFPAGTALTAAQANTLVAGQNTYATLAVSGAPTISDENTITFSNKAGFANLGFSVSLSGIADGILAKDALSLAQNPLVTEVKLAAGESLSVTQAQFLANTSAANNVLSKIHSSTGGTNIGLTVTGVTAANAIAIANTGLVAGAPVVVSAMTIASGQTLNLTESSWNANAANLIAKAGASLQAATVNVSGVSGSNAVALANSQYVDSVTLATGQAISMPYTTYAGASGALAKIANLSSATLVVSDVPGANALAIAQTANVASLSIATAGGANTFSLSVDQYQSNTSALAKISNLAASNVIFTVSGASAANALAIASDARVDGVSLIANQTIELPYVTYTQNTAALAKLSGTGLVEKVIGVTGANAWSVASDSAITAVTLANGETVNLDWTTYQASGTSVTLAKISNLSANTLAVSDVTLANVLTAGNDSAINQVTLRAGQTWSLSYSDYANAANATAFTKVTNFTNAAGVVIDLTGAPLNKALDLANINALHSITLAADNTGTGASLILSADQYAQYQANLNKVTNLAAADITVNNVSGSNAIAIANNAYVDHVILLSNQTIAIDASNQAAWESALSSNKITSAAAQSANVVFTISGTFNLSANALQALKASDYVDTIAFAPNTTLSVANADLN
jgi:hypothetical protein